MSWSTDALSMIMTYRDRWFELAGEEVQKLTVGFCSLKDSQGTYPGTLSLKQLQVSYSLYVGQNAFMSLSSKPPFSFTSINKYLSWTTLMRWWGGNMHRARRHIFCMHSLLTQTHRDHPVHLCSYLSLFIRRLCHKELTNSLIYLKDVLLHFLHCNVQFVEELQVRVLYLLILLLQQKAKSSFLLSGCSVLLAVAVIILPM